MALLSGKRQPNLHQDRLCNHGIGGRFFDVDYTRDKQDEFA
jgi:hypothetical protein